MHAVEFVRPGGKEPWPEGATEAQEACREAGLLVGKGGLHGNCFRIAPPMTVTTEEVKEACGMIADAFDSVRT
jgi:4-aminobutyrate aminotransferase